MLHASDVAEDMICVATNEVVKRSGFWFFDLRNDATGEVATRVKPLVLIRMRFVAEPARSEGCVQILNSRWESSG